jgi:hypothetical protein
MRDVAIARRQRGENRGDQGPTIRLRGGGAAPDANRPLREVPEPSQESLDRSPIPVPHTRQTEDVALAARTHLHRWPKYATDVSMRSDSVLLLQLTPLAGLRLGFDYYSHLHLTGTGTQVADLLSSSFLGTRKLLSFIPSRYNHISSLHHATNCVVAKVRQILTHRDRRHPDGEAHALMHYTRALKSLQTDLGDEARWMAPETLCAAELLVAFEVSLTVSQCRMGMIPQLTALPLPDAKRWRCSPLPGGTCSRSCSVDRSTRASSLQH